MFSKKAFFEKVFSRLRCGLRERREHLGHEWGSFKRTDVICKEVGSFIGWAAKRVAGQSIFRDLPRYRDKSVGRVEEAPLYLIKLPDCRPFELFPGIGQYLELLVEC